ncbi:MAG: peptide chain release factor-like protein [Phycisphaeraceae bacterium]|nr:MAG: peptide chain release factor-like protein [Phycisphaeraceae bacterium]
MPHRDPDVEKLLRSLEDAPAAPREPHPAMLDDDALLAACEWTRSRDGGPGGQHRNKVETAVHIKHVATGIEAKAGERRTVRENKRVAILRLRLALATGYRAGVPDGECRSAMWRARVKKGRIVLSTNHADFPAMLSEALDVIEACGMDLKRAGTRLECSPTQLARLVKEHPPAWVLMNEQRVRRGLHALR